MPVGVLAVMLLMASCRKGASTADAGPTGTGARTLLPALGVSVVLPPGVQSTQRDGSVVILIRPDARYSPVLELGRAPPELAAGAGKVRRTLRNGAEVSFETRRYEGEGSGGPSAELAGVVRVGRVVMRVRCADQADQDPPEATWCLPLLETLREEGPVTGAAATPAPPAE